MRFIAYNSGCSCSLSGYAIGRVIAPIYSVQRKEVILSTMANGHNTLQCFVSPLLLVSHAEVYLGLPAPSEIPITTTNRSNFVLWLLRFKQVYYRFRGKAYPSWLAGQRVRCSVLNLGRGAMVEYPIPVGLSLKFVLIIMLAKILCLCSQLILCR